jgi:hypothetical protein
MMFLLLHEVTVLLPLPLLLGFVPATVLLLMPLLLLAPGGLLVVLLLLDAGRLSKLVTESVDRHSSNGSHTRCSRTGSEFKVVASGKGWRQQHCSFQTAKAATAESKGCCRCARPPHRFRTEPMHAAV